MRKILTKHFFVEFKNSTPLGINGQVYLRNHFLGNIYLNKSDLAGVNKINKWLFNRGGLCFPLNFHCDKAFNTPEELLHYLEEWYSQEQSKIDKYL